jgi:peptidoglycan-associated lipoprotein
MRVTDVTRASGRALAALALVITVGAGCGGKKGRPPALTDAATGNAGSSTARTTVPRDTAPTGADLNSLSNESTLASDMAMPPADASTEGGPLADIQFELDSAALSDAARSTLAGHATWLKTHAGARVTVEGHCDERGTTDYNLALGESRARAAREYLVGLGVAANRLQTVSFGKEKPLDPSSNEAAWARNRRAHFVVVGG